MLRRTLITITTIAIVGAAFFGVRHYTQADAAYPITTEDADVNYDGRINSIDLAGVASKFNMAASTAGRPVLEQNLDSNGNIKVHEQGLVATQAAASRIINVAQGVLVPPGDGTHQTSLGGFLDVRDCVRLDAFIEVQGSSSSNQGIALTIVLSPNGAADYSPKGVGGTADFTSNLVRGSIRLPWNLPQEFPGSPYVRFMAFASNANDNNPVVSLSLYCTHV